MLWNINIGYSYGLSSINGGRWDLALSHYNGGSIRGALPNASVLPATRKYVEAVLKWQKRYAEQATVWLADDGPAEGWESAHTRVVSAVDRTLERQPGKEVQAVWTPAAGGDPTAWTVPTWGWPETGSLDDFDDGMELRRLLARGQLDDYSPVITWTGG